MAYAELTAPLRALRTDQMRQAPAATGSHGAMMDTAERRVQRHACLLGQMRQAPAATEIHDATMDTAKYRVQRHAYLQDQTPPVSAVLPRCGEQTDTARGLAQRLVELPLKCINYGLPVTGHPTLCCPVSSRCLVRYFTNGVPPVPTCDGLLGSVCACFAM